MGADQMNPNPHPGAPRPPLVGRWLLSRLLPSRLRPTAVGDFAELYHRIFLKDGRVKAALWYWREVIRSVPDFFRAAVYWRITMIGNYLKMAFRLMRKRPEFTLVNIGGLAIGLAGCILAFLFIQDEYSFDRFHDHVERIYEVRSEIGTGNDAITLETRGPVGPALATDFPEVEASARLAGADVIIRAGEKIFLRKGLGVDPSFFSIFNFPLVLGDPASALSDPYSVVLGRETARLCFGASDPVGRTISLKVGDRTADYRVTGIAEKIPDRSSLDFDLLLPLVRVKGPFVDQWVAGPDGSPVETYCFVRLREGADANALAARFPATLDKRISTGGKPGRHFVVPFAAYHRGARDYPFSTILKSRGSPQTSVLLTSIAFLILLVAGLNFMNLSAGAAASDRVKEIGLRKVFGADRNDLLRQFRFEGAFAGLAALAGGFGLASLVLPAFNRFVGKGLRLDFLKIGWPLAALILLAVLVGAAAGSYPGWALTRSRPADLFRGRFFLGRPGGFNRAFALIQFGISIFLLITAFFLYRQHRFLVTADPGYDTDRIAVLDLRQASPASPEFSRFLPDLKSRLMRHPEIRGVSGSGSALNSWSAWFLKRGSSPAPELIRFNNVDLDYFNVLGLRLRQGRWFSPEIASDASGAVVVNEAFARLYAPSQPIGKNLAEVFGRKFPYRIIGVVGDFHFDSMHTAIQPAMMILGEEPPQWAYVRLGGEGIGRAMAAVEKEFKAAAPDLPFLYSFLDEDTARLYEKEARWSLMVGLVSLFAVLIACSGVFGLAIQITARKKKEIGVRKVMGASVRQIAGLINGEFLKTAAAAGLLAWPVSFLAVKKILAGYPYRISPAIWVFPASTAALMILVLLTINLHTLKAARTDPAETLRSE